MSITQLWLAANEKCGKCDMDELLDVLYNLHHDYAQLEKYVNTGAGLHSASFDQNSPKWEDFFMIGCFNIKVLPGGRLRFQRLFSQLQS